MKSCSKCKKQKPKSAYGKHGQGVNGKHPTCKACRKRISNLFYAANRIEILRKQKDAMTEERKQKRKDAQVKYDYGLTPTAYHDLISRQRGRCRICGKKCLSGKQLAVDHDHLTKKVRGLLCQKCNTGLGQFNDSPSRLRRAAEYLEKQTVKQ